MVKRTYIYGYIFLYRLMEQTSCFMRECLILFYLCLFVEAQKYFQNVIFTCYLLPEQEKSWYQKLICEDLSFQVKQSCLRWHDLRSSTDPGKVRIRTHPWRATVICTVLSSMKQEATALPLTRGLHRPDRGRLEVPFVVGTSLFSCPQDGAIAAVFFCATWFCHI